MDPLEQAINHFQDHLLVCGGGLFPSRGEAEKNLHALANMYGKERLVQEFEQDIAQYHKAIDDAMLGGQFDNEDDYAKAMDEDLETPGGQSFGQEDLEKWGNIDNLFSLHKTAEKQIKKFSSFEYTYEVEMARLPCVLSPTDSIVVLPRILEKILDLCTMDFNQDDRVNILLDCAGLDQGGIYLTTRKLSDLSIDALMQKVALLNSQKKLCVDQSFSVRIFRTVMPRGGAKRKHLHVLRDRKRHAHSIVSVRVENNLCLPAALVLGKFRLLNDTTNSVEAKKQWKTLTHPKMTRTLRIKAEQVVRECGMTPGPKFGLDQLSLFQEKSFSEFQVQVFGADNGDALIATVPESREAEMQTIYLLHENDHFDLVTSPSGFHVNSYFCEKCDKPYSNKEQHRCEGKCGLCYRYREDCLNDGPIKCDQCCRTFNNPDCYAIHIQPRKNGKTYCDQYFVCRKCQKFVNLKNRKGNDPKHECGEVWCAVCREFVFRPLHLCFLKPMEPEEPEANPKHIYFDYETFNTPEGHVPNLIIAQYADGTEFRFPKDGEPMTDPEKIARDFGEWLFSEQHRGYTIIALNFRSYDGHFILRHMLDNKLRGVKVIKRGNQILDLQYPSLEMNARDTLNFVAQGLAGLPKAVGLKDLDQKGNFPHRANVPENWDKIIPFPDVNMYMIDKLPEAKRIEFAQWHAEEKARCNGFFHFRQQITGYCSNDVTVLRKCALKLRGDFIQCNKLDCLRSVTIVSACQKVFRCFLMQPNEIAIISAHGYQASRRSSSEATQWLEWLNMSANCVIVHGRNGKEQQIGRYFADGIDLRNKTVYEYNGCVFHGHPVCTEEEDRVPFGNLSMREAYEQHLNKLTFLQSQGYTVEVKWSCEWLQERKDPDIAQFLLNMNLRDPLRPSDAFKGGRTNAARLYYEAGPDEKILHYDIVSLYPYVNKTAEYPIGHPEIIVSCFKDVQLYFGFVYCKVQPPRKCFFPVLPTTINKKLIFTLCRTCAESNHQALCTHTDEERSLEGVWCTPELHHALLRGYKIEVIYEVWHWSQRKTGLFAEYVNHFLKEKVEASGWPKDCDTDAKKREYLSLVKEREGIEIDYNSVEPNPGRRAIAKLMLDSLWGKFGQRDNLHQTKFIHDPKKYFDLLRSDAVEIHDVFAVSPESMMVTISKKDDYNEGNNGTNVAIAAFTTSWARLKLHKVMERLGKRLLYYDTDSVIFIQRPGDWTPPTGNILGDWTSEMQEGESHIVRFVCCGPKVYSYVTDTGRMELKVRGITQNGYTENILAWDEAIAAYARTGRKLDFNQLKRLLDGSESQVEVVYPEFLKKNFKTQTINTVQLSKRLKMVYDKRVLVDDFQTIPFGTTEL